MTAHVSVKDYGASTATVCADCGLDEPHARWKDAQHAAATHNHQHHVRLPHDDQDGMGLA